MLFHNHPLSLLGAKQSLLLLSTAAKTNMSFGNGNENKIYNQLDPNQGFHIYTATN